MSGRDRVSAGAMWPTRIRRSGVVPVPARIASIPAGITAAESRIGNSGSENGCRRTWGTARCWTTMPASVDFQPRGARIGDRFRLLPLNLPCRRYRSPRLRGFRNAHHNCPSATHPRLPHWLDRGFLYGRLSETQSGRSVVASESGADVCCRFRESV